MVSLKGSFDAFLKIIILCIWCNRICWHALMFQKHIIFQILYIIVGPLCPASLKRFIFYKDPPSDKHSLLWLANWPRALWLAEYHKPRWKCNAPFHNRELQLSKLKTVNNVHSFTISSSPRGEQSRVTDTVMKLVCVCNQAAVVWLCLPLSHTQAHTHETLRRDPLSLSHTHTHIHTTQKTPHWNSQ